MPDGATSRTAPVLAAMVLAAAAGAAGCLALAPVPYSRPGAVQERTVVLLVEGTPGLMFEGSYGTPSATTTVRGAVPERFVVKTRVAVVATFTKAAPEGTLVVRVLVDDQEVARRTTSLPYGTVVISRHLFP